MKTNLPVFIVFLFLFVVTQGIAQSPVLIKDIFPGTESSAFDQGVSSVQIKNDI